MDSVVRDFGVVVAEQLESVVVGVGGGVVDGNGVVAVVRDGLRAHRRLVAQETHLAAVRLVGELREEEKTKECSKELEKTLVLIVSSFLFLKILTSFCCHSFSFF